jgi:site-specific recombinase XerD
VSQLFGTVPSEPLFSKERVLEEYIEEFVADWKMAGKAEQTAQMYACHLTKFFKLCSDPTLAATKVWLSEEASPSTRRKKGQALRAFGVFASNNEYEFFQWWKLIPLAKEKSFAQETVTEDMYLSVKTKLSSLRDKALIETLWSCGLRRSELANLQVEDVNFSEGFLVVRTAKNGKPRVAPLSPIAKRSIRRFLNSPLSEPAVEVVEVVV